MNNFISCRFGGRRLDPVTQKVILLQCLFDEITFRENRYLVLTPGKEMSSRKNTYFANKFLRDTKTWAPAEGKRGSMSFLEFLFELITFSLSQRTPCKAIFISVSFLINLLKKLS